MTKKEELEFLRKLFVSPVMEALDELAEIELQTEDKETFHHCEYLREVLADYTDPKKWKDILRNEINNHCRIKAGSDGANEQAEVSP